MSSSSLYKRVFFTICLVLVLFVVHRIFFLLMIDRQIFGEIRRHFIGGKLNRNYDNKYETPQFRRINVNTKTDRLQTCSWLDGKVTWIIKKGEVRWSGVSWGEVRSGDIELSGEVRWGGLRWGQVTWNYPVNWGEVGWGVLNYQVRWRELRWGQVTWTTRRVIHKESVTSSD